MLVSEQYYKIHCKEATIGHKTARNEWFRIIILLKLLHIKYF